MANDPSRAARPATRSCGLLGLDYWREGSYARPSVRSIRAPGGESCSAAGDRRVRQCDGPKLAATDFPPAGSPDLTPEWNGDVAGAWHQPNMRRFTSGRHGTRAIEYAPSE